MSKRSVLVKRESNDSYSMCRSPKSGSEVGGRAFCDPASLISSKGFAAEAGLKAGWIEMRSAVTDRAGS